MINYKEAKKILIKSKIKIKDEIINSSKSLNRINTIDIYSAVNYPAGTNAAFDGFAINSKDTNKLNKSNSQNFKILKTISAGDNPSLKKTNKFEAVEVMTGALIPNNFDTIIPIEKIIFDKNRKFIVINGKIKNNQHIRYAGSDYKKRDLIIKKGTIIQPSHILAFKTLGIVNIKVKKKPNILFFSTGNEISKLLKCSRTLVSYYIDLGYQKSHQNRSKTFKKTNRFAKKEEVRNKFGGKCQICSYDKCQSVLSFHHLPGTDKKFTISDAIVRRRKSDEELVNELKKCILVCANCHGEIHAGITEIPEGIKNPLTISESMVN